MGCAKKSKKKEQILISFLFRKHGKKMFFWEYWKSLEVWFHTIRAGHTIPDGRRERTIIEFFKVNGFDAVLLRDVRKINVFERSSTQITGKWKNLDIVYILFLTLYDDSITHRYEILAHCKMVVLIVTLLLPMKLSRSERKQNVFSFYCVLTLILKRNWKNDSANLASLIVYRYWSVHINWLAYTKCKLIYIYIFICLFRISFSSINWFENWQINVMARNWLSLSSCDDKHRWTQVESGNLWFVTHTVTDDGGGASKMTPDALVNWPHIDINMHDLLSSVYLLLWVCLHRWDTRLILNFSNLSGLKDTNCLRLLVPCGEILMEFLMYYDV